MKILLLISILLKFVFCAGVDNVTLLVCTRARPGGTQVSLNDASRLTSVSTFKTTVKTLFFTHGWQQTITSEGTTAIQNAVLTAADWNVIIVNWDTCSMNLNYLVAVNCVPDVGQRVGKFIADLTQSYNYPKSSITLVGHSLGAHISGFMGKTTKGLPVIVGLDPAGPSYFQVAAQNRLSTGDAKFVQAIHTDAGVQGVAFPIGNADYWPNGGVPIQPGCLLKIPTSNILLTCSHQKALSYYAESVLKNNFYARQCSSYFSFWLGLCRGNPKSLMGGLNVDTSAAGNYYLTTNPSSPFAQGDNV